METLADGLCRLPFSCQTECRPYLDTVFIKESSTHSITFFIGILLVCLDMNLQKSSLRTKGIPRWEKEGEA